MKMDQIAYLCRDENERMKLKTMFGLDRAKWIEDKVTAKSEVMGCPSAINVAKLEFNYDLGVELEILTYVEGPNWHDINPLAASNFGTFLSHIGIHLGDNEAFPEVPHWMLVQETWTQSHTAPLLVENGRKYHYKIYMVTPGTYVKYIKRIHKEA